MQPNFTMSHRHPPQRSQQPPVPDQPHQHPSSLCLVWGFLLLFYTARTLDFPIRAFPAHNAFSTPGRTAGFVPASLRGRVGCQHHSSLYTAPDTRHIICPWALFHTVNRIFCLGLSLHGAPGALAPPSPPSSAWLMPPCKERPNLPLLPACSPHAAPAGAARTLRERPRRGRPAPRAGRNGTRFLLPPHPGRCRGGPARRPHAATGPESAGSQLGPAPRPHPQTTAPTPGTADRGRHRVAPSPAEPRGYSPCWTWRRSGPAGKRSRGGSNSGLPGAPLPQRCRGSGFRFPAAPPRDVRARRGVARVRGGLVSAAAPAVGRSALGALNAPFLTV